VRGRRAIALALVLAAGLAAGSSRSSAAVGSSSLGVYRGAAAPDRVRAYESWLGRSVGWAVDFVPRDSWDKIEDPGWLTSGWHGSPYHLSLTVPMLPDTGGTLDDGASGAYDAHFVTLARNLVGAGYGDATIRLGHEFNGGWYRWSAAGKEAAFASYWRHVVDAMRSVPGQHFTFDWCVSAGTWGTDVAAAYPGDAYVDYVGLDVYDQDWGSGWQSPVTRWQDLVSQLYGLQWQKDFAAAHGKRMSLPEWGVVTRTDGHGGNDDPYFIQQMYAWISANDYAYTAYFEFNAPDGDHELAGSEFPNASAAFRQLFGAAPAAAPTTTVAPPPAPAASPPAPTTTAAAPATTTAAATPTPPAAPATPAPVTTTAAAPPTSTAAPAAKTVALSRLGVYRGGGAATSVREYETWLGHSVTWVLDYLPRGSWAKIENPGWLTSAWRGTPYRLALTVPMLPDTGGTLAAGARGNYDAHFVKLAKNLVRQGYANASLRLGHEFNGTWYRWSAAGREATYAKYFRRIVTAMRSVPGQHFTFDWCPNANTVGTNVEAAYPGDAFVDTIGLDAYDQDWATNVPATRWHDIVDGTYGLQWQKTFAAAHHKRMTLPEWGVFTRPDGHGGGDDPLYVNQMYDWIASNDYAYAIYFEFDAPDGTHALMSTRYPKASAAFRASFGARTAASAKPKRQPARSAARRVVPRTTSSATSR
jgi:beta-mannanase